MSVLPKNQFIHTFFLPSNWCVVIAARLCGFLAVFSSSPRISHGKLQDFQLPAGSAIRSHRTGRTTQEVEEWTDPEEAAKEVVLFGWIFCGPKKSKIMHGLPGV